MAQKTITVILVLIVIGGLAWFSNRAYLQSETAKPSESSTAGNNGPKTSLIYTTRGAASEIWQVDPPAKPKKIFTDADEKEKVTQFSNLAMDTHEVLAVTASNKLVQINLDKPEMKTLRDSFSRPETLNISEDAEKVVYSRFSNVEENYGYTLYLEDKNGQNKKTIANSEQELRSPAWSRDMAKIAYTTSLGTEAQLIIYNLNSSETTTIARFNDRIIDSIGWGQDVIYFAIRNIGAKAGEIIKIDALGQGKETILSFEGGMANFLNVSQSNIAYLIAQYSGKLDDQTSGQIYVASLTGNEKEPMKKGVQILGWLP